MYVFLPVTLCRVLQVSLKMGVRTTLKSGQKGSKLVQKS